MPPANESRMEVPLAIALLPPSGMGSRLRTVARLLYVHFERNARIYIYFKIVAILGLLQSLAQTLIFLYLGGLVDRSALSTVGGNYASFLIIGMIVLQCLDKTLIAPFVSLSGAFWSARLEALLMSPYSIWFFILADTLWYNVLTFVNAAVILLAGLSFGAAFVFPTNVLLSFLSLILSGLAVFGLGLMSASLFSLINAKGHDEPISWTIHLMQGIVCGLYFPFNVLPGVLQIVGLMIPHTYAIDTARRVFIPDYPTSGSLPLHWLVGYDPLFVNLACLLCQVVVYLPAGIYMFSRGLRKAQEAGSLSRWT